jgi:hypothetical protein
MFFPCLTTVALPLTFLTIATGAEASAGKTSPPVDRRRKKAPRKRSTIFEQTRFISDTFQRFSFIQILLTQELSQKDRVEDINDFGYLTNIY